MLGEAPHPLVVQETALSAVAVALVELGACALGMRDMTLLLPIGSDAQSPCPCCYDTRRPSLAW